MIIVGKDYECVEICSMSSIAWLVSIEVIQLVYASRPRTLVS